MKKVFFYIFALVVGVLFCAPALAAEKIENFSTYLVITDDGSVAVEETITYDFGTEIKHGIYRDIPVRYRANGKKESVNLLAIEVVNPATSEPWQFSSWSEGDFKRIRIGDPDVFVTGTQQYTIKYVVTGAINGFENHDELYWNAVGTGWEVPIEKTEAVVIFSEKLGAVPLNGVSTTCFAGTNDGTQSCTAIAVIPDTANTNAAKQIKFSQTNLAPHEGLTLVLGFPKGHVALPTSTATAPIIWKKLFINPIWLTPIATIALLYLLWRYWGQDPKGRGTIVAEYDAPEGLSPSQVAGLWGNTITTDDISADIMYLATRKYVKIIYDGKDYILVKFRDTEKALAEPLSKLIALLFAEANVKEHQVEGKAITGVKLEGITKDTRISLDTLCNTTLKGLIEAGYFTAFPGSTRGQFSGYAWTILLATFLGWFAWSDYTEIRYGVAVLVTLLTIIGAIKTARRLRYNNRRFHPLLLSPLAYLATLMQNHVPIFGSFSMILTSIATYCAGRYMSVKTQKGVLAHEQIAGLERYIKVAEEERIKFHNAPEKKPELFEKLLPFAMVLGLEEKWEKEFEDIYHETPEWFEAFGTTRYNFRLQNLHGMNTAVASSIKYLPPVSRYLARSRSGSSSWSGGSGFRGGSVGGGRGGGGGGSW